MRDYDIQNGVFLVHGIPQIMVSADYPYYRDDRAHWQDRLEKLRDACHVRVVTFYIPWRHHQLSLHGDYDFTGQTQANRDVIGFIALIQQLGMLAVAKPGPFIHAETNFGSLPDWVSPTNNPSIQAWQNAQGAHGTWSSAQHDTDGFWGGIELSLPAPFDPIFLAHTQAWLRAVGQSVITPHLHPHGAIIVVQIANEGVYSDGQAPVWEYDYSPSAIDRFGAWLQTQYADIETYNAQHGTEHDTWAQAQPPRERFLHESHYRDWGAFSAVYLGDIYRAWLDALNIDPTIPIVINLNPPVSDSYGVDAWLARVEPERYPFVHYGFTNWIGDVSADTSAFDRYLLTAKRAKGINFEENWGFSKLYDASYIDPATSFFQTLLAFGGGATGYNIYTGVNTASWDDHLDALHERPYPDCSPILDDGTPSYKATIARWLNLFLEAHGTEFLGCAPLQHIAYGVVQADAHVSMWDILPRNGLGIQAFQRLLHENGLDYGVVSLNHATPQALSAYPFLLHNSDTDDAMIVEKLRDYQQNGGKVFTLGQAQVPQALTITHISDVLSHIKRLPHPQLLDGDGTCWLRVHPTQAIAYGIVLIPQGTYQYATFDIPIHEQRHTVRVDVAQGCGAIFRIENGVLTSVLCKGVNGWLKTQAIPSVTLDNQRVGIDQEGDFLMLNGTIHAM
jgi:beta-galactosidase